MLSKRVHHLENLFAVQERGARASQPPANCPEPVPARDEWSFAPTKPPGPLPGNLRLGETDWPKVHQHRAQRVARGVSLTGEHELDRMLEDGARVEEITKDWDF